jgi:hypothetical protein
MGWPVVGSRAMGAGAGAVSPVASVTASGARSASGARKNMATFSSDVSRSIHLVSIRVSI